MKKIKISEGLVIYSKNKIDVVNISNFLVHLTIASSIAMVIWIIKTFI